MGTAGTSIDERSKAISRFFDTIRSPNYAWNVVSGTAGKPTLALRPGPSGGPTFSSRIEP